MPSSRRHPSPMGDALTTERASRKEKADPARLLASLQQRAVSLELDTTAICFLLALRLRAERMSLASFSDDMLFDVYDEVCELTEPGAPNPRKRATHAIQRFRDQRLLSRVDGTGAVQAGEYAMTALATGIVAFYVDEETLTRESLSLLTGTLIANVTQVLTAAKKADTEERWRNEVVAPLRITVGDLVSGIERRQRGMDAQQEEARNRIATLLDKDWFMTVGQCEMLLEETTATLRELNEILLRDTTNLQYLLQEIERIAEERSVADAVDAASQVDDQIERVAAWGRARQDAWSSYFQYVQRFLRDTVRLDPGRAVSQRLRDQLIGWPDHAFSFVCSAEPSIRLLREADATPFGATVQRQGTERDVALSESVADSETELLETLVSEALAGGAETLSAVLRHVLPSIRETKRYASTGRATHLVAEEREPAPEHERAWVAVPGEIEIEDWNLRRRRAPGE